MTTTASSADRLRAAWSRLGLDGITAVSDEPAAAASAVGALVGTGVVDLPLPGAGRTRERFEALAVAGELDLTVGRLVEAHADAVAILAELGAPDARGDATAVWAVWASEAPSARVGGSIGSDGWWLDGRKAWCSGAGHSTSALVTADVSGSSRLFAVDLGQPGVRPVDDPWPAVALSGTDTRSVEFSGAAATAVGEPGEYTSRPGFWHGAVGVAAVWFGGSVAIGRVLQRALRRGRVGEIDQAHLGAVAVSLAAARSALAVAAEEFDNDPADAKNRAAITARTTRAIVEASAAEVIDRVGRALGPGPLALDLEHARRVTDLQLYLRQSHADRDLADLGRRLADACDFS